jgi:hypothetical protein
MRITAILFATTSIAGAAFAQVAPPSEVLVIHDSAFLCCGKR